MQPDRRGVAVVRAVCAGIAVAAAPVHAQPAEPAGPDASPARSTPASPVAPVLDEGKIRELVDREVARILTERAAREAAERAARDSEKEVAVEDSDVKGGTGFMDTRIAFTLTNENLLAKPGQTVPNVPGWRFGTPNSLGVLFFDGYDTRYSGFETLSHATM